MIYNEETPSIIISLDFSEFEFKNNIQIKFPFITKDLLKDVITKNKISNAKELILVDIKQHYNCSVSLIFLPYEENKIICVPKNNIIHNQNKKNQVLEINLREPMTSIFSMFPVLVDNINKEKTDKAIQNLEAMQRQSYILLKNINNISLANKILSGEEFEFYDIDFSSLVKSIVSSVKEIMPKIQFELEIEEGITIKGSKQLLSNGILALISNSIKYKVEDIKIKIELNEKKGRCILVYKDNSIGIKDELISNVFNSYYSKDPYNDTELSVDTGVGLFVLKTAVEHAKGTVFLTSEFSNGVKYSISLPIDNSTIELFHSKPTDYLLNRYSEVFIQLSEYCELPDL